METIQEMKIIIKDLKEKYTNAETDLEKQDIQTIIDYWETEIEEKLNRE